MGLFAEAGVAIDGSKFKAVNNRDKNFTRAKMQRRMAQIEESVARYLHQLDSADRQEPSLASTTKSTRLKEKIAKLKEEMQAAKGTRRADAGHAGPADIAYRSRCPFDGHKRARAVQVGSLCLFYGLLLLENSSVKSALPPVMEPLHSDAACPILLGPLSGPAAGAVHWCVLERIGGDHNQVGELARLHRA
jgi:hypothetical protein